MRAWESAPHRTVCSSDWAGSGSGSRSAMGSQLSSTTSIVRPPSQSITASSVDMSGWGGIDSVFANTDTTAPGSDSCASSTSQAPSSYSAVRCRASSMANRVLSTPPVPVSVNSLDVRTTSRRSAKVSATPIIVPATRGRFERLIGIARSGGKSVDRPSASTWNSAIVPRSRRRCSPRGRTPMPDGSVGASRRTSSEMISWSPFAAAATRAAWWMARPTKPSSCWETSPTCSPIRTLTSQPGDHGSACSPRCICTAAVTAAIGASNETKNESPSVPCSTPPFWEMAARTISRCRPINSPYCADALQQRRGTLDVTEQSVRIDEATGGAYAWPLTTTS